MNTFQALKMKRKATAHRGGAQAYGIAIVKSRDWCSRGHQGQTRLRKRVWLSPYLARSNGARNHGPGDESGTSRRSERRKRAPPPRGRAAKRKSRSNPTSYLPSSGIHRDNRVDRWNELTTEHKGAVARDPGDCRAVEICGKIQSFKRS